MFSFKEFLNNRKIKKMKPVIKEIHKHFDIFSTYSDEQI